MLHYKLLDDNFLDKNSKIKDNLKFNINNPIFKIQNSKFLSNGDKFETMLFLPEGEDRKGEGGLRTKGYFKFSYCKGIRNIAGIRDKEVRDKDVNDEDWWIVDFDGNPLQKAPQDLQKKISEYINKQISTQQIPLGNQKLHTTNYQLPTTHYSPPTNKIDKLPLITVITVVYNGEKTLEQTIQSVINQTYPNVEYIIIDGGSTDGTLDIIKKYEDYIDYWVSEKDSGISDAFNKGVIIANGVYINFQGDGDGFYTSDALKKVFQNINPHEDIFISASIQRISPDSRELYRSKYVKNFNKSSLLFRMSMPHQGLFTHKSYFKKYGLFDVNNTFCMDYEHLLRAYKEFPKVVTKDIVVARWRADGLGNGRTLEIFKEYDKIKRDNKVASSLVLDFIKYWTLFKYYIKKYKEKMR